MHYDCLSLGPARMDVFVRLPDVEVDELCSIDRQKCIIQLGFGEKIAVRGIDFAVGGNTGNNAVGLTRLGHKVAMIGGMGDGWSDTQALEILKKEGVETKYIHIEPGKNGFGIVINYQEERTILSYYAEIEGGFPDDAELTADWIYLTTAGAKFEALYDQATAWAMTHKAKIAFNPGSRQLHAGLEKLKSVLMNSAVVFVNREEAAGLLAMPVGDIKSLLKGLKNNGPQLVVITDGPGGTYSFDGQDFLHMPIIDAPVVERTGAGDGFGAGFLAAVMAGKTTSEALQWGTVNSASVLGFIGPQSGLLTSDKMPSWLQRAQNVRVEKL
jgi:sugar/nucleoside kinase (ribokinase family)